MKLVKKILLVSAMLFSLPYTISQYASASALPYTFIEGVSKKLGDVPQTAQTFASDYQQALYTVGAILASQLIFNKLREYYKERAVVSSEALTELKKIKTKREKATTTIPLTTQETAEVNQAKNEFFSYEFIPELIDMYVDKITNREFDEAENLYQIIQTALIGRKSEGWLSSKILKTTGGVIPYNLQRKIIKNRQKSSWWPSLKLFGF